MLCSALGIGCLFSMGVALKPADYQFGQVLGTHNAPGWASAYAAMAPSAIETDTGYRLWVNSKSRDGEPWHIGWVDLDRRFRVVGHSDGPVLALAAHQPTVVRGLAFPEIVDAGNGVLHMYYIEFEQPPENSTEPFYGGPHLAISTDGGTTWDEHDAFNIAKHADVSQNGSMSVLRDRDGWQMWYSALLSYYVQDGRWNSVVDIRYAESEDGITWTQSASNVAIASFDGFDKVAKPSVVKTNEGYRLFFCASSQGTPYQMFEAQSRTPTGFHVVREIKRPSDPWCSEMICYPNVLKQRGRLLVFFSGNGFGRDGCGVIIIR